MPPTAPASAIRLPGTSRSAIRSAASARCSTSTSGISRLNAGRPARGRNTGRAAIPRQRWSWKQWDDVGFPPLSDDPELGRYLQLAVARRPTEELFDIVKDPGCLNNLAANPQFESVRARLWKRLKATLEKTGDARVTGTGDIWETYERYSRLRAFPVPDWAKENPESVPPQKCHRKRMEK